MLPRLLAARDPQIRVLALRYTGIGDLAPEELQTLNNVLSSCSHLKELYLPSNDLGRMNNEALNNLADTLSSFSELEVLDLSGNLLGSKLITLLPAIQQMPNLEKLNLDYNTPEKIKDANKLTDLNKSLVALPKLKVLKIDGGNKLTRLLPSLIEARNQQIRVLNLSYKDIEDLAPEELQTLNNALLSCHYLEELDLARNNLGNRLITLLPAIQGMHNLKKLVLNDLRLNEMDKDNLDDLQAGLASLSNLEELNLAWNNLGNRLITLLPAIQGMPNLKKVGFRRFKSR